MAVTIHEVATCGSSVHSEIERQADELFRSHFGVLPWDEQAGEPAPHGLEERAIEARRDGSVAGFARVLNAGDYLHLEQLSVAPDFARQGVGRLLVEAVITDASKRGFRGVTLRTFADVPWNAPFYESCGFVAQAAAPSEFHAGLEVVEARLGLLAHGPRVHMVARC